MRRMPLATYAGMWQAMGYFMAARMPIFANGALLLYVVAIGCFARYPRSGIFWTLLGCLSMLLADTVFTLTQQLPINRAVQALDATHLTDPTRVQQLRDVTIDHFYRRGSLSIAAFVWLAFAIVFLLAGQQSVHTEGSRAWKTSIWFHF